jgi:hypothetical protein
MDTKTAVFVCVACGGDYTPGQVRGDGLGHYLCPRGHGAAGPVTHRSTPVRGFLAGAANATAISVAAPLVVALEKGWARASDTPMLCAILAAVLLFVAFLQKFEAGRLSRTTESGKRLARYTLWAARGVLAFLPAGVAIAGHIFYCCVRSRS